MIIKSETTWMEAEIKSSRFLFTSTRIILASADWASIGAANRLGTMALLVTGSCKENITSLVTDKKLHFFQVVIRI